MKIVPVHNVKSTMSRLLAKVMATVLARVCKTIFEVAPVGLAPPKRRFGALAGEISVGPEFFEPLPEEELASWE